MDRKILLIDKNKMLARLLAKKIESTLNCRVDLVFSLDELGQLLDNEYFLVFIDSSFLSPQEGLERLLAKNWPLIALGTSDDDISIHKDILDYIFKESDNYIDQIVNAIMKLDYYVKTKVILAISKLSKRHQIKKILKQRKFNVLIAAHGEEAMNYLNDNNDIHLIIADANMPIISAKELLSQVRMRFSDHDLGVIILGDKNDNLEFNLLKNGANEYLIEPLNKENFNLRLDRCLNYMSNMKFLSTYSNLDPISGLKNYNTLLNDIEDYLNEITNKQEEFVLAFLDIDNLKNFNEEYGYEIGNNIIKICANEIINETKGRDIVGRYSAEKICILLKKISKERGIKILSRIRVNIKKAGILVNLDELFFTVSIGVVFAKSKDKFETLVHKASRALLEAKSNGKDRVEICS